MRREWIHAPTNRMKVTSRKVAGYLKAVLALKKIEKRRAERYDRYVRPLDRKRDVLIADVALRARALNGGQAAQAQRVLREIDSQRPFEAVGPATPERAIRAGGRATA